MECNKDEAVRAKGIAEKKMLSNDFEGARKFAQKAIKLFPDLENMSQLLAVCDVHCSAACKIYGSEKDLYGILQVERLADEATIRKQYRKLALVLHPDKNKFPGAEAAFKLIGEANMILSDKGKRYLHDIRCKDSVKIAAQKQPHHQAHQNSGSTQAKVPNTSNFQFSSATHRQPTKSGVTNGRESFWTSCPFCKTKYQYYSEFVNTSLRCQGCSKPFIAYEIGAQGAPMAYTSRSGMQGMNQASNGGQPAVSQQRDIPKQGSFKVGTQRTGGFSSVHSGSQTNSTTATGSDPLKRTDSTEAGFNAKTKVKQNGHMNINMEDGKEKVAMRKADAPQPKEAGTSRNKKRGRNFVVESSESCDTNMEKDVFEGSGAKGTAGQDSGAESGDRTRKSSRQRHQVSYNVNANDVDNNPSPPKKSRETKASGDSEEKHKKENSSSGQYKSCNSPDVLVASAADKKSFGQGNGHAEGVENGKHTVEEAETVTGNNQFEEDSDSDCAPDPEFFECPDPEFSDFDKDKEECCFAVNQIWACYDTIDGMPRFYAHVKKVYSPGFRLRITWLEAIPDDKEERDWAEEGLPVACGKFELGNSEDTSDRLTFSHQIVFEKGRARGSYVIYPRKGEIWALFKGWDIKWKSDPDNHKKYKFEIVEVLSDFVNNTGIQVAYLEKVKGFVSLFQKTSRTGISDSLIPSSELLRFSHRVPCFKMSGTERQGVPPGSFELDPAALPTNLDDLYCSDEVKMETESMDAKNNGSCSKSLEEKLRSRMGNETMSTPKKCVSSQGKNDFSQETFMLRRSPRELNKMDKNDNRVNAGACSIHEGTKKHLNGIKEKNTCISPSRETCQVNEEIRKPMNTSPNKSLESPIIRSSLSSGGKKLKEVFHDFHAEKSEGKFEVGQIWALYVGEGEMPRKYAQIKKIESAPFRLYATLLEVCGRQTYACCGIFKSVSGKYKLFQPSSFSHLVKAECNGKTRFNIYPKEQEIWALYKSWNAKSAFSDLVKGEYDIVEVLESSVQCIKVLSLLPVDGTKSIFKAPRRQRSSVGVMEIPHAELARFSHQIPAFQLTGDKDVSLIDCWELDLASLPGGLSCSK